MTNKFKDKNISIILLKKKYIVNQKSNSLNTHKDIIRYFMTIEEASNLVLNVYKIAKGGEVFLLDMGEPIKLIDLAKFMIQFSGKTEKTKGIGDIEIKIIGLRKGEKLYEELLVDNNSKNSDINHIFQSIEEEISQKEFLNLYDNIKMSYIKKDKYKLIKFLKHKSVKYKIN